MAHPTERQRYAEISSFHADFFDIIDGKKVTTEVSHDAVLPLIMLGLAELKLRHDYAKEMSDEEYDFASTERGSEWTFEFDNFMNHVHDNYQAEVAVLAYRYWLNHLYMSIPHNIRSTKRMRDCII